jgi:hypothetical protein
MHIKGLALRDNETEVIHRPATYASLGIVQTGDGDLNGVALCGEEVEWFTIGPAYLIVNTSRKLCIHCWMDERAFDESQEDSRHVFIRS